MQSSHAEFLMRLLNSDNSGNVNAICSRYAQGMRYESSRLGQEESEMSQLQQRRRIEQLREQERYTDQMSQIEQLKQVMQRQQQEQQEQQEQEKRKGLNDDAMLSFAQNVDLSADSHCAQSSNVQPRIGPPNGVSSGHSGHSGHSNGDGNRYDFNGMSDMNGNSRNDNKRAMDLIDSSLAPPQKRQRRSNSKYLNGMNMNGNVRYGYGISSNDNDNSNNDKKIGNKFLPDHLRPLIGINNNVGSSKEEKNEIVRNERVKIVAKRKKRSKTRQSTHCSHENNKSENNNNKNNGSVLDSVLNFVSNNTGDVGDALHEYLSLKLKEVEERTVSSVSSDGGFITGFANNRVFNGANVIDFDQNESSLPIPNVARRRIEPSIVGSMQPSMQPTMQPSMPSSNHSGHTFRIFNENRCNLNDGNGSLNKRQMWFPNGVDGIDDYGNGNIKRWRIHLGMIGSKLTQLRERVERRNRYLGRKSNELAILRNVIQTEFVKKPAVNLEYGRSENRIVSKIHKTELILKNLMDEIDIWENKLHSIERACGLRYDTRMNVDYINYKENEKQLSRLRFVSRKEDLTICGLPQFSIPLGASKDNNYNNYNENDSKNENRNGNNEIGSRSDNSNSSGSSSDSCSKSGSSESSGDSEDSESENESESGSSESVYHGGHDRHDRRERRRRSRSKRDRRKRHGSKKRRRHGGRHSRYKKDGKKEDSESDGSSSAATARTATSGTSGTSGTTTSLYRYEKGEKNELNQSNKIRKYRFSRYLTSNVEKEKEKLDLFIKECESESMKRDVFNENERINKWIDIVDDQLEWISQSNWKKKIDYISHSDNDDNDDNENEIDNKKEEKKEECSMICKKRKDIEREMRGLVGASAFKEEKQEMTRVLNEENDQMQDIKMHYHCLLNCKNDDISIMHHAECMIAKICHKVMTHSC